MKTAQLLTAALLAFGLGAAPALAQDAKPMANSDMGKMAIKTTAPVTLGDLEITRGYIRAMPPRAPAGGGFITVTNKGKTDDTLIAASSPDAGAVELHEMAIKDNVMIMRQMKGGIPIPAGKTVVLQPGGLHIMFLKVPEAFKEGQTIPVTLTFKSAGTVKLDMPVISMAATMQMKNMKMDMSN